MTEALASQNFPYVKAEEPGTRVWCACGRSKSQPYCDGSHKGTGIVPLQVEIQEKKNVAWCGCRLSKTMPFCDGSHKKLPAV